MADKKDPRDKRIEEQEKTLIDLIGQVEALKLENKELRELLTERETGKVYDYVRYEVCVRGKPGWTFDSSKQAHHKDTIEGYCAENRVPATDMRVRLLAGFKGKAA